MGYRFNSDALRNGLSSFATRADMAVRMYAETASKKLESSAKTGAKWTDRTGAARNRLNSYVQPQPTKIRIVLAHGVDYGIWLELAHEKRYAIIQPTIDLKSVEIFAGLDKLFERIGR